jgi:hypothetical protein
MLALQTQACAPSPHLHLTNDQGQALQHLCEILSPTPDAPPTITATPTATANQSIAHILRVPPRSIIPTPRDPESPPAPVLRVGPPPVTTDAPWTLVQPKLRAKRTSTPRPSPPRTSSNTVSQSQSSTQSQTAARTRRRQNRNRHIPPRIHVAASAIHCDTGLAAEYRQPIQSTDGPFWEDSAVE